ncbi:DUF2634 domain-containing protein [Lachnospiraceae bacterium ZAX-1]
MAEKLFPVFDVPAELVDTDDTNGWYRPAPLFDVEKGDFVTDGSGRVLYGSGRDAWILWCTKTAAIERFAYLGYDSEIGAEIDGSFKEPDRGSQESEIERTVTEALLADPMGRTQQVQDFDFVWGSDSLEISCTVIGSDGDTASINLQLKT